MIIKALISSGSFYCHASHTETCRAARQGVIGSGGIRTNPTFTILMLLSYLLSLD
jgi:hypothetical protein